MNLYENIKTNLKESNNLYLEDKDYEAQENAYKCPECEEITFDISALDTDQEWTDDGDRVIIYKCPHCGAYMFDSMTEVSNT